MRMIETNAYIQASRYIGLKELQGKELNNPEIMAMLKLDNEWPENDEVPWCSAFINKICWQLRLSRSKSLLARSWLKVGIPVELDDAEIGFDVVILKRGGEDQPGPEDTTAPGHVGFYAGHSATSVYILAGNQGNEVSIESFIRRRILGVRRLLV